LIGRARKASKDGQQTSTNRRRVRGLPRTETAANKKEEDKLKVVVIMSREGGKKEG